MKRISMHRRDLSSRVLLPALSFLLVGFSLQPTGAEMSLSDFRGIQSGELQFEPAHPAAGQVVEVTFRPGELFQNAPLLHLRARLRTPKHDSYNGGMGSRQMAVLQRKEDGLLHGSFSLPSDVVYAAFAVEDVSATRSDSRQGKFWDLMMHEGGIPIFDALEQRLNDHMGRDAKEVLETARIMVRHYPNRVESWSTLRFAEGLALSPEEAEARQDIHREKLRSFDRTLLGQSELTADQVGYMYWYARTLDEQELMTDWRELLLGEYPEHFFAVQERYGTLRSELGDDWPAILKRLEAFWKVSDGLESRTRIARWALSASRAAGDAAGILRWVGRSVELNQMSSSDAATMLAGIDATREKGIRRLRVEISRIEQVPDGERPLGATLEKHRTDSALRAAYFRTQLGRALLETDRSSEAIEILELVPDASRFVHRYFATLGDAYLATGDTVAAMNAFAAVAADPATSEADADSLRTMVGADGPRWTKAISRARGASQERIMRSSRNEPLPSVNVRTSDGSRVTLQEYIGSDATVIVFWSRYCGPSTAAMPRISALAEELEKDGVRVLAVTQDPPAEAEPYLKEGGWDITVFYDGWNEAAGALNNWGTPQYFVLDRSGHLRFAYSSLSTLPREIAALRAK